MINNVSRKLINAQYTLFRDLYYCIVIVNIVVIIDFLYHVIAVLCMFLYHRFYKFLKNRHF